MAVAEPLGHLVPQPKPQARALVPRNNAARLRAPGFDKQVQILEQSISQDPSCMNEQKKNLRKRTYDCVVEGSGGTSSASLGIIQFMGASCGPDRDTS